MLQDVFDDAQLAVRDERLLAGPAGTRKTTAITQLIMGHEDTLRLRHPDVGPRMPMS